MIGSVERVGDRLNSWRNQATNALAPPPTEATVGGVKHRLIWLDRRAGYRLQCTCGWVDSRVRWTGRRAMHVGKGHIRSARLAARRRARGKSVVG
jgi:glucose-6-phosphate dehydrogenase assembly protein OpcA